METTAGFLLELLTFVVTSSKSLILHLCSISPVSSSEAYCNKGGDSSVAWNGTACVNPRRNEGKKLPYRDPLSEG